MLTGDKNLDIKILNSLEDRDLVNFCQTNKMARQLCQEETFWMNRILSKFPYVFVDIFKKYKNNRTWTQYYINDLVNITPFSLIEAAKRGRLDRIMIAVAMGADINDYDNAAIYEAARNGHLDVVKYLVSKGADVNFDDGFIIVGVSDRGQLDVMKYLAGIGVNIRHRNDIALSFASRHGYLDMVKYLVSQGADISVRNNEPVRFASIYGRLDVIDYLVGLGAPNPRN